MKLLIGVVGWALVFTIRLVLMVLGWFFVPLSLLGDGAERTPRMWRIWAHNPNLPAAYSTSRWKRYVWWAWRNPTPGWIGLWTQPIPEKRPNPDHFVRVSPRSNVAVSAHRWMQHNFYWEYWYMRQISWGKYKWFEFRIGWKFVDGNDEFFPTIQLGPRSS